MKAVTTGWPCGHWGCGANTAENRRWRLLVGGDRPPGRPWEDGRKWGRRKSPLGGENSEQREAGLARGAVGRRRGDPEPGPGFQPAPPPITRQPAGG